MLRAIQKESAAKGNPVDGLTEEQEREGTLTNAQDHTVCTDDAADHASTVSQPTTQQDRVRQPSPDKERPQTPRKQGKQAELASTSQQCVNPGPEALSQTLLSSGAHRGQLPYRTQEEQQQSQQPDSELMQQRVPAPQVEAESSALKPSAPGVDVRQEEDKSTDAGQQEAMNRGDNQQERVSASQPQQTPPVQAPAQLPAQLQPQLQLPTQLWSSKAETARISLCEKLGELSVVTDKFEQPERVAAILLLFIEWLSPSEEAQAAIFGAAMSMAEEGNKQLGVFTSVKVFLESACKECDAVKAKRLVTSLLQIKAPM